MYKKAIIAGVFMLLVFSSSLHSQPMQDWKDQILYFVLIDRFENGNKSNDSQVNLKDPQGFHGGDVPGLIRRLDYLKELGITGIWLSPFLKNRPDSFFKQQAYHGYWPHDFWQADERFASEQDLVDLRHSLSRMQMKLLLDMVVNHMGYDAPFVDANPDWFNPPLNIENWDDAEQLINRRIFGLPDFASQKPVVKTFFKLVAKTWINKIKPDGFRLDAVKHVPLEFWNDYNQSVKEIAGPGFLMLGEYLHGDPQAAVKVWKQGGFDSIFDFPLYYTIKEVFAEGGDMRKLASRIYLDRNYPDAGMLATFIDNHDLDRFITSCGGDEKKYRLALAFLLTARGIPTLCYGDEQGLSGAHNPEPENRRSMVFDNTSDLFKFTRDLIAMRKKSDALRRGLTANLLMDESGYVFARLTPDSLAIVAINNGDQPRQIDLVLPFDIDGQPKILDAAMGSARALLRDGRLETFLPAKSFVVFTPASRTGFYDQVFRHWQKRFYHEDAWGFRKIILKLKVDYLPEKAKVFITGNAGELGNWNPEKGALPMEKVMDDEYEVEVKMPLGKIFECKCFYRLEKKTVWQSEANVIAEVKEAGSEYIHLNWKTLQKP